MSRSGAIIFLGPPGSGKTTQADEIVRRHDGFYHFNLGRFIEKVVHDPKNADDPKIQEERKRFEAGLLTSNELANEITIKELKRLVSEGLGVIFSGFPRNHEEAEIIVPALFEAYGEGNVIVLSLSVSQETSLLRNTNRRVCSRCGHPMVWARGQEELTYCDLCGGMLVHRSIDEPKVIEERLREYERKTKNILDFFIALGIPVFTVGGEEDPASIAKNIEEIVAKHFS